MEGGSGGEERSGILVNEGERKRGRQGGEKRKKGREHGRGGKAKREETQLLRSRDSSVGRALD